MEYRQLGRSGLRVSAVAYGNWVTHGSQLDDDAAAACVAAALDAGITTFDTADRYAQGRAEEALGKALSGVRRSSIELCTKVYLPVGPGANDSGLSRKHVTESCHASLGRLGTDYIDLYQAHRYDDSVPLEETMTAFADLVRQGKVLYVGASEWTAPQLRAGRRLAAELHVPFIANQPQYSMLWRVVEAEVVPVSAELGLGQLAWAPLAMGVLTGKYQPGQRPRPVPARPTASVGRSSPATPRTCCSPGYASSGRSPRPPAARWPSWPSPGCCTGRPWPARSSARPVPSSSPRRRRPPRSGWTPS
ncbi:hypothetical protein GCM10027614_61210 [Micromonospora vulcania]